MAEPKEYTGPFEIDPVTGIEIRKGSRVLRGSELQDLYQDTVARHLARAEGKDPDNPVVLASMRARIRKPVVMEPPIVRRI